MANTRLSNCAQLMRARVEAVGESLVSLEGAWPGRTRRGRSGAEAPHGVPARHGSE